MAVVTGDRGSLAVVGRSIAAGGAVAVLLPSTTPDAARVACGWLADHAAEVGADPLTLTLVTVGLSYDAAAALADSAVDDGWPSLDVLVGLPDHAGRPSHVGSIEVVAAPTSAALGEFAVAFMQTRRGR